MLILMLATAGATPCGLQRVQPPGRDITVAMEAVRLPRGSLVRAAPQLSCEDTVGVEVVAVNWRYLGLDAAQVEVGHQGCVPASALRPLTAPLLAMEPHPDDPLPPAVPPGTWVDDLDDLDCDKLHNLRPLTPRQRGQIMALKAVWDQHFAPLPPQRFGVSDWGYVSLPYTRFLNSAEIRQEWARESLNTPSQREKQTTAVGPHNAAGDEVYLHFLGTDARFSDTWGTPELVSGLIELAAGWHAHCLSLIGKQDFPSDRRACTIQYGDLAWYNNRRPDPLGHHQHADGHCVDIRLFRDDGARYESYWNRPDDRDGTHGGYSRPLNIAFASWALQNAPVRSLLFNDPELIAAVPGVERAPRHDDHFHLCLGSAAE